MQTGENIQALRQILDFIRFGSITLLLLHFYLNCFPLIEHLHLNNAVINKVVINLYGNVALLNSATKQKIASLILLSISLIGSKGKKDEKLKVRPVLILMSTGLFIYFFSITVENLISDQLPSNSIYILLTAIGYLLFLAGGSKISRLLFLTLNRDIFNEQNETFPQEERLLTNEYSINLPAQYKIKGNLRRSWVNIINPFRALLVLGTPGSGKSFFIIRHVISQHIRKGFSLFIYDFKFPDLTRIAYNNLKNNYAQYKVLPKFYVINFDDLSRSHRSNPLSPETMHDITDATESSRTIMLALNRDWIKKQGDFFVESAIVFTTAIFWFLKRYKGGKYCTLPHSIELAQVEYSKLFPVLSLEPEIEVLINPFLYMFMNGTMETLDSQVASAKICLARLASPQLYYVLSGNDFTLDLNNPEEPKLICVGNNPSKQQIYGAVLSLYIERMLKLVNQKEKIKSSLVFDEFPTIYVNNIDNLIATARSNRVATTLGIQDFSQLKRDYGKDQAEVIMNIAGNIIAGQVIGETAKNLSERIGKITQNRESISINSADTSLSKSTQLESAIPPSKIANLSSGEFVGAVADDPTEKIKLKVFHCELLNDIDAIKKEESGYVEIPSIREIDSHAVIQNYYQIKKEVQEIISSEMERIENNYSKPSMFEKSIKPKRKSSF